MKVEKSVSALRAEDYKDGDFVVKTATLVKVEQKPTEYGDKQFATVRCMETNKTHGVFLNQPSIDELIDGFGAETDTWGGRAVSVRCAISNGKYKKKMLIVLPLEAVKV